MQCLQDAVTGRIEVMISSMPSLEPFVRTGKLRVLGITTEKRFRGMEELPAIAETLPGHDITCWVVLAAPAGTPADVVSRLNRAANNLRFN